MPLKSRFGWLNCSLGAVKGQGLKEAWSPGRRANKHPLSSAQSGGCGDQMIIEQYKSAVLQWVSNLFTCMLLYLRNKKNSWQLEITAPVSNVSSEFHWINEITWATRPGGEVLVSALAGAPHWARALIYSRFALNLNDDLHFLPLRLEQAAVEVALRRCLLMKLWHSW